MGLFFLLCLFINVVIFDLENEVKVVSLETTVEDVCVQHGIKISEKKNLNPSNSVEDLSLDNFLNSLKKVGIKEVFVSTECYNYDNKLSDVYWKKTYNAWSENGTYVYHSVGKISYGDKFFYCNLENATYSEIFFSRDVTKKAIILFFLAIIEVAILNMSYSYILDKYRRRKAINGT